MTTITPEQLDEARARAMYESTGPLWDDARYEVRRVWLGYASAIREADDALGVVSVPKEATAAMREAGRPAHITHEKTMEAGIADIDHRAGVCINAAIRAGAIGGEDHG